MTLAAGLTITYALDGDGRAQRETRGGKNHYYLLDGKNVLKEWGTQTVTVTSSSGTPAGNVALRPRDLVRLATATGASVTVSITQEIIDYTHGLGLISDRTTISRWYRWDGIGSLRNLEDSGKNLVASTVFDAYGLQQNSTTLVSAYGFIGEEGVRGEKGLAPGTLVPQNMRARMYDPSTGRFTSRDPIWDKNFYQYGNGNPWSYTDPSGMQARPRSLDEWVRLDRQLQDEAARLSDKPEARQRLERVIDEIDLVVRPHINALMAGAISRTGAPGRIRGGLASAPPGYHRPAVAAPHHRDWGTVLRHAAPSLIAGVGLAGAAGLAVAAGVVSAPLVIGVGAAFLAYGAVSSFAERWKSASERPS